MNLLDPNAIWGRAESARIKLLSKLCIVVLAIILEPLVLQTCGELIFGRSHGPIADTRFRRKERLAAYYAHAHNPSSETDAAYQEELRLMRLHPNHSYVYALLLYTVLIVANGIAVYYFLRDRNPSRPGQQVR